MQHTSPNRKVHGNVRGIIVHGAPEKIQDDRRPMFAQANRNSIVGQGRMRAWSSDDQGNALVHRYEDRKN